MSIKLSERLTCAIADPTIAIPIYYSLSHLTLARFSGEQEFVRSKAVDGGAFAHFLPSAERYLGVTLEGLSDGSGGEALLHSAFLEGMPRLLRIHTAQGKQLAGSVYVVRLQQEAAGERFERITVELRSDGPVTFI